MSIPPNSGPQDDLTPDEVQGEIKAAISQAAQDIQQTPGHGEPAIPQENALFLNTLASSSDSSEKRDSGAAAAEVRDIVEEHERRRRVFPRAALVGLLAGLLAVAFRTALDKAEAARTVLVSYSHTFPLGGVLLPVLVCAACGGIGVWLVQRFAPEAAGSGIPHLEAVLHRLRPLRWRRLLPVKFVAGVLSLGGGLALGREGPTVQMGGATGALVAERFRSTARERQTLIAAGAGAGLAAAFNAPLAGVVFVLEEVQRDFSPGVFGATFVACVIADVVARVLTGQLPVFHTTPIQVAPPLQGLPLFVLLGGLCGVLGVAFNRALLGSLRFFEKLRARFTRRFPKGAGLAGGGLAGALAGLLGWFSPTAVGGGHGLVDAALSSTPKLTLYALAGWFVLRFALTMTSYGSGAAGGIFAPLLVLGAQLGLAVGLLGARWFPQAVPHSQIFIFAVVGMAAYFTAIVRAPLTGIVLIVEMTGGYSLMLPLLVACFCAYGVADLLGDLPVYEALLERDLKRAQDTPHLEGTLLLHLKVQHGSAFQDRKISDLHLPTGSLIVTIERGLQNRVATPDTVLEADDRFTAVVAPEAAEAVVLLREGVEHER